MDIRRLSIASISVLSIVTAQPAFAHHSFADEFDASRPILLRGAVKRMEFTNPLRRAKMP